MKYGNSLLIKSKKAGAQEGAGCLQTNYYIL